MRDMYYEDEQFDDEVEGFNDFEDDYDFEDEDEDFFEFSESDGLDDYDELDDDFDNEFEDDWDGMDDYDDMSFDDEGDPLFGRFKKRLKSWGRKAKKFARKAAIKLARTAKKHAGKIGTVIGGAVAGPAGAKVGGRIGKFVKNLEDEDDGFDSEDEMNARIMIPAYEEEAAEAMAAAASKSSPSDAQALGGALTINIMSRTPLKVKTLAPAVASAAGRIAKSLAADPSAKPLIKVLPTIIKDTTASLDRKVKKGKPVTRQTVARVMTKQAKRTLNSTPRLARALTNNAVKRRKLNVKAISRAEKYY